MRARVSRIKVLLSVAAIIMGLVVAGSAFAAGGVTKYPWNIPANVRIVQKDTTDNARIFGTVQAAINSISGASATNRFIVKVMPGVYNESVTMKDYVDLEGSGTGNTVIQSNAATTVKGANQTTIRNLKIVNTAASTGVDGFGLDIDNVTTTVENAVIEATGAYTGTNAGNYAMYISGSSANVSLKSVNIKAAGAYYNYGIRAFGGTVIDIADSQLTSTGSSTPGSYAVNINCAGPVTLGIRNSVLKAYDAGYVECIYADGAVSIMSSKMSAKNGGVTTNGLLHSFQGTITGSEIAASSSVGTVYGLNASGMVGSSLIGGGVNPIFSGLKIVNCWDENFNPIPNQ